MHVGKDLVAASSAPLVLAILSEGENYGYAILKRVNELSDGNLDWTDGMLYPLLHRLNRMGWVEATWRQPDSGRRRRYYRLTQSGADALVEQRRQWEAVNETLTAAWQRLQASTHPAGVPA